MMTPRLSEPLRILVAEDDVELNRLIVTWLKRSADVVVDAVFDGEQAIEKLKETKYSAILLDMMMPRVTGFDVVEYVTQHQPKLLKRIVVVTAGGSSIIDRLQSNAIYQLIEKPFDLRELLRVALECAQRGNTAEVTFSRAGAGSDGKPYEVLVVDDDEASRYLMTRSLVGDFATDYAGDGREAIEKLKLKDYDVVLLDLRMPGVDGFAVIHYLQEHQRHTLERVVVVTVSPEEAPDARIAGVIPKPVDPQQLTHLIYSHLLRLPVTD
jgi:CheY-like chemotaxis protein